MSVTSSHNTAQLIIFGSTREECMLIQAKDTSLYRYICIAFQSFPPLSMVPESVTPMMPESVTPMMIRHMIITLVS